MRRWMLTAASVAAALTPIGRDPAAGTNLSAFSNNCMWTDLAAVENGTITTVRADLTSAVGDIAFFTIDSSNVVRAITANMTAVAGVNNYSVNLAVQIGDRIGVYNASGGTPSALRVKTYTAPGTYYRVSTALAKPNPGDTRTPTNTGAAGDGFALLATGNV